MTKALRTVRRWLAAMVLPAAVATALLMAEPPDLPVRRRIWDLLAETWSRPYLANQSYGATLTPVIQATALAVLPWFGSGFAGGFAQARFLDRTPLDEGRKVALQPDHHVFALRPWLAVLIHASGLDPGSLTVFSGVLGFPSAICTCGPSRIRWLPTRTCPSSPEVVELASPRISSTRS